MTTTPTVNPFNIVLPPYIHDAAFETTEELRQLARYAEWSVLTSPTGLYVSVAANAVTHIRPGIKTPLGTEPNLHVALCGRSGNGKSTAGHVADAVVPPAFPMWNMRGTWQGLTQELRESVKPYRGALWQARDLENFLYAYGVKSGEKILGILHGEGAERKAGGLEPGSYRLVLRTRVYSLRRTGWLFTPHAFTSGVASTFLYAYPEFADSLECRKSLNDPSPDVSSIVLPDWSAVPDGPVSCPPAAEEYLKAYNREDAKKGYRLLIHQRFVLAMAHAALHGRTEITDDDWLWTAQPMAVSRAIARENFEICRDLWRWTPGKLPVRIDKGAVR